MTPKEVLNQIKRWLLHGDSWSSVDAMDALTVLDKIIEPTCHHMPDAICSTCALIRIYTTEAAMFEARGKVDSLRRQLIIERNEPGYTPISESAYRILKRENHQLQLENERLRGKPLPIQMSPIEITAFDESAKIDAKKYDGPCVCGHSKSNHSDDGPCYGCMGTCRYFRP